MRRAASSNAALLLAFSVSAGAHQERKFGVVGVLSADGHAALRQAQRKTWIRGGREASAKDKGGGGAGVEVVFLLDRPTAATAREAAARGDVRFLNASFSGRANHFGEKLALWLRLARRWFPGAAFVAKVDDDAYVCAHAWDAVWARASPRMYLGWFHRHGSHRADEMFVVLGAELVDRLAARRYCGSAGTCDRARDLVDTGYAGTSLGIWLGAYRDVAEVDLRRAGLTNSARGNESCGAAQLIAHPVKDPAAVARLGARLGQRTRAEEEGLLDDHGDVPPPFDVADWFGGGCGRRLAGVTVVETRFMQGQGQFPELVAARLRQLLAVAVPSVVHQTNQCFVWVLLTDPKLPAAPRRSVAAALRAHPHARLVDYPVRTIREAPNVTLYEEVFGAAGWRQAMRNASELTLVRLDADDGLHVHYLQLLADWRARHRGELSAASTYAYACSSRSLDWKSASAKEWVAGAGQTSDRVRAAERVLRAARTGLPRLRPGNDANLRWHDPALLSEALHREPRLAPGPAVPGEEHRQRRQRARWLERAAAGLPRAVRDVQRRQQPPGRARGRAAGRPRRVLRARLARSPGAHALPRAPRGRGRDGDAQIAGRPRLQFPVLGLLRQGKRRALGPGCHQQAL